MAWEVYAATAQIEAWIDGLSEDQQVELAAAVEILAEEGPSLGRPLVDRVHQSRHHKMKELRPPSSGRTVLRVLFAFDKQRRAALLIGGDKAQNARWNAWYAEWVPVADRHLDEIETSGTPGRSPRSRKRGPR